MPGVSAYVPWGPIIRLLELVWEAVRRWYKNWRPKPPPVTTLMPRLWLKTRGFRNRGNELRQLAGLMADGRGVIWVTGPSQAGKSWLVSRQVRDRRLERRACRFELERDADLQRVLDGINWFLYGKGETGFNEACIHRSKRASDKIEPLLRVLSRKEWVILLDSYDQIPLRSDVHELVQRAHQEIEKSTVLIGSHNMPDWAAGGGAAEVEVGAIGRAAGSRLLVESGVPLAAVGELYDALGGLPGALVHIRALVKSWGANEVTDKLIRSATEVGEKLLGHTFDALSEGAKRLWAGLCLLPAPVTRDAAREMCERDDFDVSWKELVEWKLLQMGGTRAELQALARAVGRSRLSTMGDWQEKCSRRIVGFYERIVKERLRDRDAVGEELENVMAAAELARQYEEWEKLLSMGERLDRALERAGEWAAREQVLRLCYEGARAVKDGRRRRKFAHSLGFAAQLRGDLDEAERRYRESLEMAREDGDRLTEASAEHWLGVLARLQGRLDDAKGLYNQSLEIRRELGEKALVAGTLHQLGVVAWQRGKLDEAEGLYTKSLKMKREVGERAGEAAALSALGVVAAERGKMDEAERRYRESLEMAREIGDRLGEARTLHALGVAARQRGNMEEAEQLYEQSLEIKRDAGDRLGEAWTLHDMGVLARKRGDLEGGEQLYERSLRIKRDVGDRLGEAWTLHELAVVARQRGHVDEAERLYKRSLSIKRACGDRPGEAKTLHGLGVLAQERGDSSKAESLFGESQKIQSEAGLALQEARTLARMVKVAEKQNDLRLAVARMEKAAAMFEEMGMAEREQGKRDLERLRRRLGEGTGGGR